MRVAAIPCLSGFAIFMRKIMVAKKKGENPVWYQPRGYPHFDHKVSPTAALEYVINPKNVCQHSFYPFLSYSMVTPRYKKDLCKVEDKSRPIRYAAHLDSHIFAYYSNLLSEQYEKYINGTPLSESVIAYRKLGKSNIDFAREAFCKIEKYGECVVLCFDITGFFDNLNHSIIKKQWCKILGCETLPDDHYAVFKAITKFSWVDRDAVYNKLNIGKKSAFRIKGALCPPAIFRLEIRKAGLITTNIETKGIPQGSPISAVLSNVFMTSFDEQISALANKINGLYRRYCDDILFACPIAHVEQVASCIHNEINKLDLKINDDKTEKSYFTINVEGLLTTDNPMQYLGFKFDGRKKYLRSKTLSRYWRRVKTGVRSATKAAKAAEKKGETGIIFKQELYEKFTHLGKNNFIKYAQRASRDMNDQAIRKQIKNHWEKLQNELKDAVELNV